MQAENLYSPITSDRRFKLTIAYDGANYAGWQVQKTGVAVQQLVEEALAKIFGMPFRIQGSSRTDAGVHALGMIAHVDIPGERFAMPISKLPLALNAHLPEDIRVIKATRVPIDFHARFSAKGKQYRYHVWNGSGMNPLLRHQAWHVPRKLNLPTMREAAKQFVGKHDFRSFAATRSYRTENTVRTLTRCDIQRRGALLTFIIESDGFLYKMCRGIVGTLVQIGLGRLRAEDVQTILAHKDRRAAGMSAPAHGLVLVKVFY